MTASNDQDVTRGALVDKVTSFTRNKLSNMGQGMWQLLYSSRQRVATDQPERVGLWSLADKVAQKRIIERQQTYRRGGGAEASIIDYGLNKARSEL